MKNVLTKIKSTKGYVSIETLIVAGLVIALGAFVISKFADKGNGVADNAMKQVDKAQEKALETGNGITGTTRP